MDSWALTYNPREIPCSENAANREKFFKTALHLFPFKVVNQRAKLTRNWGKTASTERFFNSLKREWLTGNMYPTREAAVDDVRAYIAYYNSDRLHTTLGDLTPIEFEQRA